MRGTGDVTPLGEINNEYKILVGNPEGKKLLGRLRHRWEYNIGIDLRGIGWQVVDCTVRF
jgi:hypothetical protein